MNEIKSGIYRLLNQSNGKFYIGKAKNLKNRKSNHFSYLRKGIHHNPKLQASYNKYGEDVFVFETIEKVELDSLSERERFWIETTDAINKGFNFKKGGEEEGKIAKLFHWENTSTKEEILCSIPFLSEREGIPNKWLYQISCGKGYSSHNWILKNSVKIKKKRNSKSKIFLSIENFYTKEKLENLTIKEAVSILGKSKATIRSLAKGIQKTCGDWTLVDCGHLFKKRKTFKRTQSWKNKRARYKLTIFDHVKNETISDKTSGELRDLTGVSDKRWLELISGRKKKLKERFSLVSFEKINILTT